MPASNAQSSAYTKTAVETASQGKLIVMLFNGAIQRAEEAKRQIEKGQGEMAHNNLIRAQEIVAELRGALNMEAGDIAHNLDRLYEYFQHLLIKANIRKMSEPVDECIEHMTEIRDSWQEMFENLSREQKGVPLAPKINPHGSSSINVQG